MGRTHRLPAALVSGVLFVALIAAAAVPAHAADGRRALAGHRVHLLTREQRPAGGGLPAPAHPPVRTRDAALLAVDKKAAFARTQRNGSAASDAPSANGQVVASTTNVLANEPGTRAGGWYPSDSTGAIGQSSYIEAVNSELRIYARDLTTVIATSSMGSFIGYPSEAVFDPQIQWDDQDNRFVFAAVDSAGTGDEYLAIGWSKTATPTNLSSQWCVVFFQTDNLVFDYPKLGHFDDAWLIGANRFDDTNASFAGSATLVIPKPTDASCSNSRRPDPVRGPDNSSGK